LDGAINQGRIALDPLRSTPPEDIAIALFKVSEACIPRSMKSDIVVESSEIELEASVQDEA
jgi:hypothetical protein